MASNSERVLAQERTVRVFLSPEASELDAQHAGALLDERLGEAVRAVEAELSLTLSGSVAVVLDAPL